MKPTIRITLNGELLEQPYGTNLAALVASLGQAPQALATAINQNFVARDARSNLTLMDGDSVTTFQPITGG